MIFPVILAGGTMVLDFGHYQEKVITKQFLKFFEEITLFQERVLFTQKKNKNGSRKANYF